MSAERGFPRLPDSFQGHSPMGIAPGMPVAQFEIGSYRNFVYLILDWKEMKAAIVDPQKDLEPLRRAMAEHGFTLLCTLLTHTHHDHVAGVPELARTSPELPIYVHAADRHRLRSGLPAEARLVSLEDQDVIHVGSLSVRLIHTPGHSAGECSYFLDGPQPYLLTGDTVFIRDCGRTDLETGSTSQMFSSLQKLKKLPHGTVILPGHHYAPECASTLARELVESPPFRCASVAELEALP